MLDKITKERTNMLDKITKGLSRKPPRILVYGTEGIGKSTFAADAPNPVFIQTEDGLDQIDCAKFPLATTLKEVFDASYELLTKPHAYKTIVLDSADWFEKLIWKTICDEEGVKFIEKACGGYGKAYTKAATMFHNALHLFNKLRDEKGMAVIMIAHAKIDRFDNPEAESFNLYVPRLHKLATAALVEWSDCVLFAHKKMVVRISEADNKAIGTPIGQDGGDRVVRCVGAPSCVAKNRYGMPEILPLDWKAVAKYFVPKKQEKA